jgi:hypothetical protein
VSDRWLRVSERVYRMLLAAYPEEFRREYRAQMEQTFQDLCREERVCGLLALVDPYDLGPRNDGVCGKDQLLGW